MVTRSLILALFLVIPLSSASAFDLDWSQGYGSGGQWIYGSAVDGSGNIIIVGYFTGTVDFGDGPLTSSGISDVFLAKFDSSGNHIWSQRFGAGLNQWGLSVAVDGSGNVIITGEFYGSINFGGETLGDWGSGDIFVAKFNPAGTHLWSQRFGDSLRQHAWSSAVDALGNVFITGAIWGSANFGGATLTSAGEADVYIAKFSPGGSHIWSHIYGDAALQTAECMTVDQSGNVIVTGAHLGLIDFGGGALPHAGGYDMFLVKLDGGGNHLWSLGFGDSDFQYGWGVTTDTFGNVIVGGHYTGTIDFGGGDLTSAGAADIYLAKFDALGAWVWSRRFGAADNQFANSVAADGLGNILLIGQFTGALDFGGGAHVATGEDIYLAKFDPSGGYTESATFGDAGLPPDANTVAVDSQNNIVTAVYSEGTVNFGGGPLSGNAMYVARFLAPAPPVVKYVDYAASGNGTGDSWVNAYTDLQTALATATANDEFWVAKGTYKPTSGTDRSVSFQLVSDVAMYGGFAGTEVSRGERDWRGNETVLSGEIGEPTSDDNSLHVVYASFGVEGAVLDGFTVTGGNADGAGFDGSGGGLILNSSFVEVSNSTFQGNSAIRGGGAYANTGAPTFRDGSFIANVAEQGGGIFAEFSTPTFENIVFSGNSAQTGGGLVTYFPAPFGAGAGAGGSREVPQERRAAVATQFELINVTVSGNSATVAGGAIHNLGALASVTNTILWGNVAPSSPEVFNEWAYPSVTFSHSLIAGSKPGGIWDSSIGIDGGSNLDEDPRFKGANSEAAPLSIWSSSPAIEAGDNAAVPAGMTTDLDGNPRLYGTNVDMGAYEYQGPATGIETDPRPKLPRTLALYQNAPNPFNPTTTIRYDVPGTDGGVSLRIYNVTGQLIRTLVDGPVAPGEKSVTWDGKDARGNQVSTGIYFYCLSSGSTTLTKKMVLLK